MKRTNTWKNITQKNKKKARILNVILQRLCHQGMRQEHGIWRSSFYKWVWMHTFCFYFGSRLFFCKKKKTNNACTETQTNPKKTDTLLGSSQVAGHPRNRHFFLDRLHIQSHNRCMKKKKQAGKGTKEAGNATNCSTEASDYNKGKYDSDSDKDMHDKDMPEID